MRITIPCPSRASLALFGKEVFLTGILSTFTGSMSSGIFSTNFAGAITQSLTISSLFRLSVLGANYIWPKTNKRKITLITIALVAANTFAYETLKIAGFVTNSDTIKSAFFLSTAELILGTIARPLIYSNGGEREPAGARILQWNTSYAGETQPLFPEGQL